MLMAKKQLTSKEYTEGLRILTDQDILSYGERIVPSQIALAILSTRAGRILNRNIITQKMKRDQLHPMGKYGEKKLYFWRSEVENLPLDGPVGRPAKEPKN